jgi:uncharacterized SAM-binding protein YcdF (DUF218 family)
MVFSDAVERILEPIKLFHDKKIDYIIIFSGVPVSAAPEDREAEKLKQFAIEWGVPAERILTDTQSRNTRENALESRRIIKTMGLKKVILVTSAYHMKRGLGCFEKAGLKPTPYPVDYTCDAVGVRRLDPFPRSEYLHLSSNAIREIVGLIVYRVVGHI